MTYQDFSQFAGTWGLVFLVVMFAVAIVYALWPSNRDKFSRASALPLQDSAYPESDTTSGDNTQGVTTQNATGHNATGHHAATN